MKKHLILTAATLLFITAFAQLPQSGLVAWFPFNSGSTNDASGNGNNATNYGATSTSDHLGNANGAYYFDGVNNYIEIPNSNSLNNQLYTISFWSKFSTAATPGSGGFNVNPALISKLSPSTTVTYDNWVFYEGNGTPGFAHGSGGNGVGTDSIFNDNEWHNITCTVNTDSIRFYFDGVLTAKKVKDANLTFNTQPIRIGRSIATYWKAYNGSIDDLAIYNRALTSNEVSQIFTGGGCLFYDTVLTSVTDTLIINTHITGVAPPNNTNELKAYPNPTGSNLYINTGNYSLMAGYTMKITNSIGQVIFSTAINQQLYNLDLSTFGGNGIYYLEILDLSSNIVANKKIVLQ